MNINIYTLSNLNLAFYSFVFDGVFDDKIVLGSSCLLFCFLKPCFVYTISGL